VVQEEVDHYLFKLLIEVKPIAAVRLLKLILKELGKGKGFFVTVV